MSCTEQELLDAGVRIFGPNADVAQDLEPEYIAVSDDGKTAWASLQENNAIAVIDLTQDQVVDIFPLGYKDFGLAENALDAGDRDCVVGKQDYNAKTITACAKDEGMINIQAWPGLYGMYMPDAIAQYQANGQSYLVTANEGDAREWLVDEDLYFSTNDLTQGYAEEIRVKHLFNNKGFRSNGDYAAHLRLLKSGIKGAKLDSNVFKACTTTDANEVCAENLIKDSQLGRLTITWTQGYKKDANGEPVLDSNGLMTYDKLYAYGGRSFSILDPKTKKIVWDSKNDFERKAAELFPEYFNTNHEKLSVDDRSDNKGPEPEGIALGKIGQKTFAFIGLERMGGIMVYDITQPTQASFVEYFNDRKFGETRTSFDAEGNVVTVENSNLGPEGLIFIAAKDSPNGKPLLVVGNEVSGTTAVYQIKLN